MKKFWIVLAMLMCFVFMTPLEAAKAAEPGINVNPEESAAVERLYDYLSNLKNQYEIMKDLDVRTYVKQYMKSGDGGFSMKKLSKAVVEYSFKEIVSSMKLMGMIVAIALICSLLSNLQKAFSNESLSNIAYFACYSLIIILMAKSFYMGVDLARGTIKSMTDLMTALIPVLLMLVAGAGGITEAAVMDPVIVGAINISSRIFVTIIIPIILMTFVLQFVNNLSDEYKISSLTKLLTQITLWAQGIIMTVFIGIITVRGITSKTIDAVTAKTAKYAVDNFVPIVGKCLSDAIAAVVGYSVLLKNALSAVGLVMLVLLVLFPVIKLFVLAMMYKLTAALIEPISDSKLVKCIESAGNSLILIMSCVICVSVMFFIMLSIMSSAGKAIIG